MFGLGLLRRIEWVCKYLRKNLDFFECGALL